jgi:hypothetical protein
MDTTKRIIDGMSLCRRWMYTAKVTDTGPGGQRGDCKECVKRRRKELEKIAQST